MLYGHLAACVYRRFEFNFTLNLLRAVVARHRSGYRKYKTVFSTITLYAFLG